MKGTMYRRFALVIVTAILCGGVFAGTKPVKKDIETQAVDKALQHIKTMNLKDVHLVSYTYKIANNKFLSEELKTHFKTYRTNPSYQKLGSESGDADQVIKIVFNAQNKNQVTVVTKKTAKSLNSNKKTVQIPPNTFVI